MSLSVTSEKQVIKDKQANDDEEAGTKGVKEEENTDIEKILTEDEITKGAENIAYEIKSTYEDKSTDKENMKDENNCTDAEESTDEENNTNWKTYVNEGKLIVTISLPHEDNITDEEIMSDEELEQFRRYTFDNLKETAMGVVELNIPQEQDIYSLYKIKNAGIIFTSCYSSHTVMKKMERANVKKIRRDIAQLIMETKYFEFSCAIVMHSYKNKWHLKDEEIYKEIQMLYMVILLNYSDSSDDLAIALAIEPGFVEIIKKMIEAFQPRYFAKGNQIKLMDIDMVETALGILHNMCMRESNVSKLRDVGMIACLTSYLNSECHNHALLALACLAGIMKERDCDIIKNNKHIVQYLLDCIRRGMEDKMRRWAGWSCKECGFIIKLLARTDANKKTLGNMGALELLVELGKTGDEDEQYESVSALWALCYDKEIQSHVIGKPELGVVDLLVDLKSSKNEKIMKACIGALWTLSDALKISDIEHYKKIGEQFTSNRDKNEASKGKKGKLTTEDEELSKRHVMISYQWDDQEAIKYVRDNIRAKGYQVWMDIYEMRGSILDAISAAVEGAAVFLMCMSNKYKNSSFCRLEADYAVKLKKSIIPLKMESDYTPDGWLGLILGNKLYFEFTPKVAFDESMKALLKEIDHVLGGPRDMPDSRVHEGFSANSVSHADAVFRARNADTRISVSKPTIDKVYKWTADDVKRWIDGNGLQTCGISTLTGVEIALMTSMLVECPEFFYKCLENKLKITDLLSISKIVFALKDLS